MKIEKKIKISKESQNWKQKYRFWKFSRKTPNLVFNWKSQLFYIISWKYQNNNIWAYPGYPILTKVFNFSATKRSDSYGDEYYDYGEDDSMNDYQAIPDGKFVPVGKYFIFYPDQQ